VRRVTFIQKWHFANVGESGESGESSQNGLANVGKSGESSQNGLVKVSKSGESQHFPIFGHFVLTRLAKFGKFAKFETLATQQKICKQNNDFVM
jgi:hypothetical protein